MSTYDETLHPRGKNPDNVGQYSPKDHAEPEGVELDVGSGESRHDLRVKALDGLEPSGERFYLAYTGPDEEMPDDLLRLAFSGDEVTYMEELGNRYLEADADDIDQAIARFDDEHGTDFTALDDADEDRERLRDYIWDHDDSDRERDLLRNVGPRLMRAPISGYGTLAGAETYWANPGDEKAWGRLVRNREKLLRQKLSAAGIDMLDEGNAEAVRDLVSEGPETWHEGVRLDVIWNGDVRDAIPGDVERVLSFENPHVVLIDTLNGSGYDVVMSGWASMSVGARSGDEELPDARRVRLDDEEDGYGWDQTAGLVHSAYNTPMWVAEGRRSGLSRRAG
jgi:hypothetical protein